MLDDGRIYNLAPVPKNCLFQGIRFQNRPDGYDYTVVEEAEMDPGIEIGYDAENSDS